MSRRTTVSRASYLSPQAMEEFEPYIQRVARIMKLQREIAHIDAGELAQLIRLSVWKYGKTFDAERLPSLSREEKIIAWLKRIGWRAILKEARRKQYEKLQPHDAKHDKTPIKELEQREAERNHAKVMSIALQLIGSRMRELDPVESEIARRIIAGENAHQIYREYLAKNAKTKAKNRSHEKVRGSRAVQGVLRKLLRAPHRR